MLFIQYYPLLFIAFPYCYYFFRNFLKPWSESSVSNKITSCSRIDFHGGYGIVRNSIVSSLVVLRYIVINLDGFLPRFLFFSPE